MSEQILGTDAVEIRGQQIATLAKHTPILATANSVNAALTAIVFWGVASSYLVIGWAGLIIVFAAWRLYRWRRHRHRLPTEVSPLAPRRAVMLALALGLVWGGGVYLFFPPDLPDLQIFLTIVVAGMSAGAAMTLASIPAAAICFILAIQLPLIARFAALGDYSELLLALMMAMFSLVTIFTVRNVYAGFLENLRNTLTNSALLQQLEGVRAELLEIAESSEAFALFDESDRLALWNHNFETFLSLPQDALVKGTPYEVLMRRASPPLDVADGSRPLEDWINKQSGRRREAHGAQVLGLANGRRLRVSDRRTSSGGTVSVWVDVTELEKQAQATRASERRLLDAVESISDGFILFDQADRLVLCNDRYREMYAGIADLLVPGAKFEDLVRAGVERNRVPAGVDRAEQWIRDRIERHRHPNGPFEEYHAEGRWVRIDERVTADGGVVGTRTDVTERKRAEQRNALLATVLEQADDAIEVTDAETRLQYVNPAFEKMTGFAAAEVLGTTPTKSRHLEGIDAALHQEIWGTISAGRAWRGTLPSIHKSGTLHNLETTISPVLDDNGTITNYVAIKRDVTASKAAEEALRRSEEQLRVITDSLPVLITYIDADERYRFVNRTAAEWLDRPAEEIIGRPVNQIHAASEYDKFRPRIQAVLSGDGMTFDVIIAYPDGKRRNVQLIYVPHLDLAKRVQGFFALAQDVTERKRAEEAIKESEERFRAVVNNSPTAILLKDVDGQFSLVNKRFEEWHGLTSDKLIGKRSYDVFPERLADALVSQDQEVLDKLTVIEQEHVVAFADHVPHTIVLTKFPVFDSDDRPIGVGSIGVDVTEQRKAEELLRQAQKMEAVGQLTGGIAHDFNNLLSVIIGNLDFLDDQLRDDDRHRFVEPPLHAALRGAELTHRLLAFSRKQALKPVITNINKLVAGMTRLLQRTLGETIEIETVLTAGLWKTAVDHAQLETALLNLAVNARHAMADGGKLTIETANVLLDQDYAERYQDVVAGRYVMVAIDDTGTGMSPEILAQAFEPFFTTKAIGEGSGLGLSMVYGFVKQSNGHAKIYSEIAKGTTVKLYFPKSAVDAELPEPAKAIPTAGGGQMETILVVEDDASLRAVADAMLSSLGYRVLTVPDGKSALAILDGTSEVDVLFADVVLPGGISGTELAKLASARRPSLKVLFASGYSGNAIARNGLLDEDVRFLSKPYRKAQIARLVRQALDDDG